MLGPPAIGAPLPFLVLGEGSPTKKATTEKGYPYSNLSLLEDLDMLLGRSQFQKDI